MEKLFVLLSMAAFSAALALWLLKPRTAAVRNAQQIREALQQLLKRPYGAYVIVEDPAFGKFVQISGSIREPLTFDLPRQMLTLDEFARAGQLFQQFGQAVPETFAVFDGPGGHAAGQQTSFILRFGNDVERVTQLALQVFRTVYAVSENAELKITEQ